MLKIPAPRSARIVAFGYGLTSYLVHWIAIVYAIGFFANIGVPKSVDIGPTRNPLQAFLVNTFLALVFAIVHWLMAREWFKVWWTRIVPPPVERSTYVLIASLLLGLLFWAWSPIVSEVWSVHHPVASAALVTLYAAGWLLAIVGTFPINRRDLFGMRQVYLYLRGLLYTPPEVRDSLLYRLIPHPIFIGYAIALWATPWMTIGHALLAVILSAFLVIDVWLAARQPG